MCVDGWMYICMYVCVCMILCMCMCVSVRVCVCMYVCHHDHIDTYPQSARPNMSPEVFERIREDAREIAHHRVFEVQ